LRGELDHPAVGVAAVQGVLRTVVDLDVADEEVALLLLDRGIRAIVDAVVVDRDAGRVVQVVAVATDAPDVDAVIDVGPVEAGEKSAKSWMIWMPISLRCCALKAVMATGTVSMLCSRSSATTVSSLTDAAPEDAALAEASPRTPAMRTIRSDGQPGAGPKQHGFGHG